MSIAVPKVIEGLEHVVRVASGGLGICGASTKCNECCRGCR